MADNHHAIIIFDGICNLCNGFIRLVIRRDKKSYFRFATLQQVNDHSPSFMKNMFNNSKDSVILIEHGQGYFGSDAILRIYMKLDGPLLLYHVCRNMPSAMRDRLYRFIATNRYRLFGKKNQCPVPDESVRERFLTGWEVVTRYKIDHLRLLDRLLRNDN